MVRSQDKRIVFSTYQAVSGSGKDGIIDFEEGQRKPPNTIHAIVDIALPDCDLVMAGPYAGYTEKN